jgi:tetraprenyl-beta-curcumene synthase
VRTAGSGKALTALAVANLRFWPSVAPVVWRELARWQTAAGEIGDRRLREMALQKLGEEAFNAEVAATLATLAPRWARARAVQAIVALEVLFDYLDGRTERLEDTSEPVGEAERLLGALAGALGSEDGAATLESEPDGAYLSALRGCVAEQAASLPSFAAVQEPALAAARRCAQAQARLHAVCSTGEQPLRAWAQEACVGSGLEWREFIGAGASSVLAVHALISYAAKPDTTRAEAQRVDAVYMASGGLITMLDSVVDEPADRVGDHAGYIGLFASGERASRAGALAREALARASHAPDPAHHAMTLAGVIAYYTSHPAARSAAARPVAAAVRRELAPVVWPALAVMRTWRSAKAMRLAAQQAARSRAMREPRTGEN